MRAESQLTTTRRKARLTFSTESRKRPIPTAIPPSLIPTTAPPPSTGLVLRTGMADASGSTSWQYLYPVNGGSETVESRTIASITKQIAQFYNFDGSIASITYPSGEVVTYAPGGAGRPLSATD